MLLSCELKKALSAPLTADFKNIAKKKEQVPSVPEFLHATPTTFL